MGQLLFANSLSQNGFATTQLGVERSALCLANARSRRDAVDRNGLAGNHLSKHVGTVAFDADR